MKNCFLNKIKFDLESENFKGLIKLFLYVLKILEKCLLFCKINFYKANLIFRQNIFDFD